MTKEDTNLKPNDMQSALVASKFLKFKTGFDMSPYSQGKLSAKGDDAQQVSQDNSMMVVVDGVGGWHRRGVDVSKYSWALTSGIGKAFHETKMDKGIPQVLREGHSKASEQVGSATVCIAHLKGNTLQTANLGDSGQAIMSLDGQGKYGTVFKSPAMQQSHNHPLQLAWDETDSLEDVDQRTHTVEKGDIIVLATDGFWDNVWETQMNELTTACVSKGLSATDVARQLVILAVKQSKSTYTVTPWTKDCSVAMGRLPSSATYEQTNLEAVDEFRGGKPDDTTVIVGIVCEKDTMMVSKI